MLTDDIYIIGSGKSLDYIGVGFFDYKVCIGLNFAYEKIPVTITMTHHHCHVQEALDAGVAFVVTSEYDLGVPERGKIEFDDTYKYKHAKQGYTIVDYSTFDEPDYLLCGGTIAISAIHLAYKLGARNIILVGFDGGSIDGKLNFDDCHDTITKEHLRRTYNQIKTTVDLVRERGVNVVSINPFINLSLEGRTYEGF